MKTRFKTFRGLFLSIGLLWPLAGQCDSKFYVKADAGGNITQDTDLREFFGSDTRGSRVKFDAGYRIGVAAGYDLCDWFALEGEVAAMGNRIRAISGSDGVEAIFSNVPFLANVRLQCPHRCRVSPYIGGGAGGAASILDIDHIDRGGVHVEGSASDVVFAYQGFAGLRFQLNPSMTLGFEYRYFAADRPTWKAEDTSTTTTDRMGFGRAQTHAFSVVFDWHF